MKTVLITEPIHPDGRAVLERAGLEIRELPPGAGPEAFDAAAAGANGVLVRLMRLDEARLGPMNGLEVVSRHGVGCDNVAVEHCSGRGVPVCIAADANARSVAEHTMALMLAGARNLVAHDRATRAGDWTARAENGRASFELHGKTLLVIGVGRVGSRVARLALAFGMRVLGHDKYRDDLPEGVEAAPDLDAALPEADVVAVHVPLTEETRDMLGAERLSRLKPAAQIVNCARGNIVDEAALLAAPPAFYATDVFREEPVPAGDPLLTLGPALLTPHVAAMTHESMRAMAVQAAENIVAAFEGRLDPGVVFNRAALGR
ncbi:MAG TPA: NAD(P)-dependent oxidoreductase [Paracoccaceae bacterium]|nr:NAD(P)-dependent oxidoreductase [Paracoccaceae bacterium]